SKREYLLAQIQQKDGIIKSLLKQLHSPPLSISIYGYLPLSLPTPQPVEPCEDILAMVVGEGEREGGGGVATACGLLLRRRATVHDSDPRQSQRGRPQGRGPPPVGTLVDPDVDDSADEEPSTTTLVDPDAAVPLGLLADRAIMVQGSGRKEGGEKGRERADARDVRQGVANKNYFKPDPSPDLKQQMGLIDTTVPPDITVHGLVMPEDVERLFEIFYARVNPFVGVLDPELHTPSSTFSHCPFLFTVVCAISLCYSEKADVYPIAMHFAKSAAANALIDGWKLVELCQAYILMSIYSVPACGWEEDRSWLYAGVAIWIATDLNLHRFSTRKARNDLEEREMINRTRIWMICFNLDKSTATQFGKPSTVKEDRIIRDGPDWYKRSVNNDATDVHLVAYSVLMQILTRFRADVFDDPNAPTGLNKAKDLRDLTLHHEAVLTACHKEWEEHFRRDSDPNDTTAVFRCKLLPFYVNYSRLVMLSFAFQQVFLRGLQEGDEIFFRKSFDVAKAVVLVLVDSVAPSGYL
ncbi:hypothetical protein OF83DRAFT_1031599, partial [Amylostereum chailletii]